MIPPGFGTIGPFIEDVTIKTKFVDLCKDEGKTMEEKMKELIRTAIAGKYPDFKFPCSVDSKYFKRSDSDAS